MNFEKVKGHLSSFTPAVQSVDLDKPAKHLCTLRHLRFFADLQRNNFVLKTFNFAMRVLKRLLKLEIKGTLWYIHTSESAGCRSDMHFFTIPHEMCT